MPHYITPTPPPTASDQARRVESELLAISDRISAVEAERASQIPVLQARIREAEANLRDCEYMRCRRSLEEAREELRQFQHRHNADRLRQQQCNLQAELAGWRRTLEREQQPVMTSGRRAGMRLV